MILVRVPLAFLLVETVLPDGAVEEEAFLPLFEKIDVIRSWPLDRSVFFDFFNPVDFSDD